MCCKYCVTISSRSFLNRIDDIVVFGQLGRDQIATIIDVQLEKLRKNLDERGITIELDDSARELIIEEGYDPIYGASPLKRAIQSLIQNPLAVSLLKGEIASGTDGSGVGRGRRHEIRSGRNERKPGLKSPGEIGSQ